MKFETGSKKGKLTIICLAQRAREILLICQCECFQIVKVSEAELKTRTACLKCEAKKKLKKFRLGDIAIYLNSIGEIGFVEQIIITGILQSSLEIEYRGRIYIARPDEVERIGINFYDRRRVKKIRQRNLG